MRTFNLQEAKKRFSELLERAERGERIGLTKEEKVVAIFGPAPREKTRLKKVRKQSQAREKGCWSDRKKFD